MLPNILRFIIIYFDILRGLLLMGIISVRGHNTRKFPFVQIVLLPASYRGQFSGYVCAHTHAHKPLKTHIQCPSDQNSKRLIQN